MSVLITGATGLIGKVITNLLHKHGYTVHYLTTRKNKIETRENYKGYYWNPTKGEIDLASLVGVNYIINLAGATVSKRWTSHYKKEILNSRINSIRTLKSGIEKSSNTTIEGIVGLVFQGWCIAQNGTAHSKFCRCGLWKRRTMAIMDPYQRPSPYVHFSNGEKAVRSV